MFIYIYKCVSDPLQEAHLLKLRAGVGESLQRVSQVVVCGEVETVRVKDAVDHGQEGFIVLHLKQEDTQHQDRWLFSSLFIYYLLFIPIRNLVLHLCLCLCY